MSYICTTCACIVSTVVIAEQNTQTASALPLGLHNIRSPAPLAIAHQQHKMQWIRQVMLGIYGDNTFLLCIDDNVAHKACITVVRRGHHQKILAEWLQFHWLLARCNDGHQLHLWIISGVGAWTNIWWCGHMLCTKGENNLRYMRQTNCKHWPLQENSPMSACSTMLTLDCYPSTALNSWTNGLMQYNSRCNSDMTSRFNSLATLNVMRSSSSSTS